MAQIPTVTINLWDGSPGSLNPTNLGNFKAIQNFLTQLSEVESSFVPVLDYTFDLTEIAVADRAARLQWLKNAQTLLDMLPELVNDSRYTDYNFEYEVPVIPQGLELDKDALNQFWKAVADDVGFAVKELQHMINDLEAPANQ